MNRKRYYWVGTVLTVAMIALLYGCQNSMEHSSVSSVCADEEPAPTIAPAPKPAPEPGCGQMSTAPGGKVRAWVAYPTAQRATSVLLVEKLAPAEVALGQDFGYQIKATNISCAPLRDVMVMDEVDPKFNFASANPGAVSNAGGVLTWDLGMLDPGQAKTIDVKGAAKGEGSLQNCIWGTGIPYICLASNVVEPKLALTKTSPAQVLLCEEIPVKYVVTNNGTGPANSVAIQDQLPAGLLSQDGKKSVTANVGTLEAGQSRMFTASLKAEKPGKYVNRATATGAGGLKAEASATTTVLAPKLEITKTGPARLYIGRTARYQITVKNVGNGDARGTVVEDDLPAAARLLNASAGAKQTGSRLTWDLGTLAPNASRQLTVEVEPSKAATFINKAMAKAFCAEPVSASVETVVTGISAVLLEVVDIEDPIEVGSNETYIVTVTNQGSAPDTNIKIVCTLEDSMQYVSSSGATSGSAAGATVTFAPLPTLAAKAKATWRVVVKAVKPGDVRFTVRMDTDELKRPVQETEATNFYEHYAP